MPDVRVASRAPGRISEFIYPFMFKDPVGEHGTLEQGHGFVAPAWYMRENVHAADEGQFTIDHDDLLVLFPEVDSALDLSCQILVARLKMPGNLVARQNHGMDLNTAILRIPKMREQLFRALADPWAPQPYALLRLIDPAA